MYCEPYSDFEIFLWIVKNVQQKNTFLGNGELISVIKNNPWMLWTILKKVFGGSLRTSAFQSTNVRSEWYIRELGTINAFSKFISEMNYILDLFLI